MPRPPRNRAATTAAPASLESPAHPLRLEWVEAGTLTPNPQNWRRHPSGQVSALKATLADPAVGWAGALLYNERTQRLVDGHARRDAVRPTDLVPVLVGSWDEAAERKILLTLDPIASLADADHAAMKALMESTALNGEEYAALNARLESTLAALVLPSENEWAGATGTVPQGERTTACTVTFTVSESQREEIERALASAISEGPFDTSENTNTNGNALMRIAEYYLARS